MERTGGCLCGAVRYRATLSRDRLCACHCGMCRRWASGPFLNVSCAAVTFERPEAVTTFRSSEWAERGFCAACGTVLFYRYLAGTPEQAVPHLAYGSLDDPTGLTLGLEVFVDEQPDGYAFAGERKRLTAAQLMGG